jgi:protein required for attachment to host cells
MRKKRKETMWIELTEQEDEFLGYEWNDVIATKQLKHAIIFYKKGHSFKESPSVKRTLNSANMRINMNHNQNHNQSSNPNQKQTSKHRSQRQTQKDSNRLIAQIIIFGTIAILGGAVGYGIYKFIF